MCLLCFWLMFVLISLVVLCFVWSGWLMIWLSMLLVVMSRLGDGWLVLLSYLFGLMVLLLFIKLWLWLFMRFLWCWVGCLLYLSCCWVRFLGRCLLGYVLLMCWFMCGILLLLLVNLLILILSWLLSGLLLCVFWWGCSFVGWESFLWMRSFVCVSVCLLISWWYFWVVWCGEFVNLVVV